MQASYAMLCLSFQDRIAGALQQRFAFVNVWVPLVKVEKDPLGLIEWSSQRPQDVVSIKLLDFFQDIFKLFQKEYQYNINI